MTNQNQLSLVNYNSEKAKKKLNLKRKVHFSLSQELLRNIESEKAFVQNENLLEEVTTGSEIVFSMRLNLSNSLHLFHLFELLNHKPD